MDLESIRDPQFLKGMSTEQLQHLSADIRRFLIDKCSKTGGHIASNLGVVELTLALHQVFNSPTDKFLWDVGHQAYVHKILTGRAKDFDTLRKYQGLSGFPKREESEHDCFETGHSSTTLSAAMGMAIARDLKNEKHHVVPIIGDGALTGGMALEALNHIGHEKRRLIVILNDNAMSIAPNVGALNSMFSRMRTARKYRKLKKKVQKAVQKVPKLGSPLAQLIERIKDSLKYLFIRGVFFEELGFTYIGVVNGHNLDQLITQFERAKNMNGPVLLHIATTKGKGYKPAEQDKIGVWHGVGPYKIETGEVIKKKANAPAWSEVMSDALARLATDDKKIIAITPAMVIGSKLEKFAKKFPKRLIDVGIAEEHATTLSAGLAISGMKPYLVIYSTFLQRAYDQILHDIARQKLHVVVAIDRAGLVGDDGETHQGVFDIAFLRHMPNVTIMMPKDENEGQNMVYSAFNYTDVGMIAVRFPRGNACGVPLDKNPQLISYGTWEILQDGSDVVILTFGTTLPIALKASALLKGKGVSACVINARFIKPLDTTLLTDIISRKVPIITLEEAILAGGFGSAVLEFVESCQHKTVPVTRMGIPDKFILHGDVKTLLNELGLTAEQIVATAEKMLKKRDK